MRRKRGCSCNSPFSVTRTSLNLIKHLFYTTACFFPLRPSVFLRAAGITGCKERSTHEVRYTGLSRVVPFMSWLNISVTSVISQRTNIQRRKHVNIKTIGTKFTSNDYDCPFCLPLFFLFPFLLHIPLFVFSFIMFPTYLPLKFCRLFHCPSLSFFPSFFLHFFCYSFLFPYRSLNLYFSPRFFLSISVPSFVFVAIYKFGNNEKVLQL